jgi:hypothetical protein
VSLGRQLNHTKNLPCVALLGPRSLTRSLGNRGQGGVSG